MRRGIIGLLLIVLPVLAACRPTPAFGYRERELLLAEDFTAAHAWESYVDPGRGAALGVENGVYRMRLAGEGYVWGLGGRSHDDVLIDVETTQRSDDDDNAYGVMCRADPGNSGEGYYFLISGDGYWSIRRQSGRQMTALVEFTRADAVRRGQATNRLTVLCAGEYLALYVNGAFVGEARDRLFARGATGFAVAARGDAVDVTFDNLRVSAASLTAR